MLHVKIINWVKTKILLTNRYYIEKFRLVGIICKYTKFLIWLFKLSSITLPWVITAAIFSSRVKLRYYSDTPGVVLAEEPTHILHSLQKASSIKNINIRIIKFRCISAPGRWSHIKKTVDSTILTFQHIWLLAHLMYAEILVSSGTQVQPQVILNPEYLTDYLSVSCDYETRY